MFFSFLDSHLTTSMEAAPDLKKSVESSMVGTLLRMPFQMFCVKKNEYFSFSVPVSQMSLGL